MSANKHTYQSISVLGVNRTMYRDACGLNFYVLYTSLRLSTSHINSASAFLPCCILSYGLTMLLLVTVLVVPMVPSPVARQQTDDSYLVSQRITHGGSTRLHRTKQCSPFIRLCRGSVVSFGVKKRCKYVVEPQ